MMVAMILRPKPPLSGSVVTAEPASAAAPSPVPTWLRQAIPGSQNLGSKNVADMALAAGAAIGLLGQVVRRRERWAGAWRQRLALAAAAVTARQAGRVEDSLALRDAVLLTKAGDDVGPAGRLLLAWRRLATRPAEELLREKTLAAVLEEFGYAPNDEMLGDLADDVRQLSMGAGPVAALTGALTAAERYGFGRAGGAWLADALLAQRLGWDYAIPLLGTATALGPGRLRRAAAASAAAGVETEPDRVKILLAAQARAALRAIDLSAELGHRAERLLVVAPKLRAKGADAVVERLLSEDALVASRGEQKTGMSDRGLRRLFDRLVSLGVVRELTGRPVFRLYGL